VTFGSRRSYGPVCALALVSALAGPARANDKVDIPGGLRWLAGKQAPDGSFGEHDKLALTGMSGLALLASGSTPTRGPFAEQLSKAIGFVLSCQTDGRAFSHRSSGYSAIHNHGYALLFLTQAYGEGGVLDERLRVAIEQGLKATVDSQRDNGGFSYYLYDRQPPEYAEMWRVDEASTTISQIQALRGARNAGFQVPRDALRRAADYVARSQHDSGGFVYSITPTPRVSMVEGSDRPTFAITAAATAVLHALGTYDGPIVDRGIAYVEAFLPPSRRKVPFFYYGHYYAAQVMHLVNDARGARWIAAIDAELAVRQRPDGHWPADPEDTLADGDSEILNSAWALQILLIETGTLPIHER
jgi:hypothetical protein